MPRQHVVHKPADRPDVEVLVDGTWRSTPASAMTEAVYVHAE